MKLFRLIAIGVAVAISILFGACDRERGAWSPKSAELAFMSDRDGDAEIYLVRGRSSKWTNLTNDPAKDNWPEWSPDGARIAFQSDRAGNLDIWVMNADGSQPTQLTTDPESDYFPAWSPDGSRITFTSWRREPADRERAVHIYAMNADGSDQRRLIASSPGTSGGAIWAPDGRTLLLTREIRDQGTDIFLADASGRVVRRLTNDRANNGAPAFSPDGARVAFYSEHRKTSSLAIVDIDGSHRRTVLSEGRCRYPRWSPDGRWLVYTAAVAGSSESDLDVLAIRVEGRAKPITLAGGPGREAEGRWRPRP
ncbi:MAG: DPP IV N-terminal domain-containing protein [Candidatus Eisenbacteria bacterium]